MRGSGGARLDDSSPGPGEARLLASGAALQALAQVSGLIALLVVVTLLARRHPPAELGAYGLVASLAGSLLVLRNSVAGSAVRAMAAALEPAQRAATFSAAAAIYALIGLATGLLIALAAIAIAAGILDGESARQARLGGVGLGVVTAAGVTVSVYLDALRAERLFVRAALVEIASVTIFLVAMLALILSGASLAVVIAVSGTLPLWSGLISVALVRRLRLAFRLRRAGRREVMQIAPTAGWLLAIELANLAMYASGRIILGAYRSPRAVGLYEGPVRAHNLLYALGGALAVPTVPTASRYVARRDERRLRELVLRGTRYTLALFVPLCVTLMTLAEPVLGVWLGDRYTDGATALAVLVSYWLLYGGLVVTPGFLVGAGRAREIAQVLVLVALANVALSLLLTPELGLEGPAVAMAVPFLCAFPFVLRIGLSASGASAAELVRRAFAPNYVLGGALAALLVLVRLVAEPHTLPAVAAVAIAGVGSYWLAFYLLVLDDSERGLMRGLLGRTR